MKSLKHYKFLIVLSSILLIGCVNQFVYNTLPFWINNYASDFVDMTSEQEDRFERDLEQFHRWHRQNELPKIEVLLEQIKRESRQPISYGNIAILHNLIRQRILDSLRGLTPTMTNLIASLSNEQAKALYLNVLAKIEEKQNDANEGTYQDQFQRRLRDVDDRAEEWIDFVTQQQMQQLADFVRFQLKTRPLLYTIRSELLEEFRQVLDTRRQPGLNKRINDLMRHIVYLDDPRFKSEIKAQSAQLYTTIFQIDNTLTTDQRRYFLDRLTSLNKDINELIRNN